MPVGTTFRAVITGFLVIPFAILLGEVIGVVVPMWQTNHWLADAMTGVADNALALGLLGALMMVIAASVTQSKVAR
jgi:hypothetical protein